MRRRARLARGIAGIVASAGLATSGCGGAPATVTPPRVTPPRVETVAALGAVVAPAPIVMPEGVRLPRPFAIARGALELELDPAQPVMRGVVRYEGVMTRGEAVIWLNAAALSVRQAAITDGVTGEVIGLEVIAMPGGRLAMRAPRPLVAARSYTLEVRFEAGVTHELAKGTFRRLVDGRAYAFTMHEQIDARRSFPCIDEPDAKLPWTMTLTVPAGLTAVANAPAVATVVTDDGRQRVTFAPTAPLPPYLVAYAVGPFDVVDAGVTAGGARMRVLTTAGRGGEAARIVETTPQLVAALERWTGVAFPFAKLDSIAVPELGVGGMENAGLITYEAASVLVTPGAHIRRRGAMAQMIARTVAHEVAHQWFGDLVTPAWWDELWLAEGFATWMADLAGDDVAVAALPAPMRGWARTMALTRDEAGATRRLRDPIESELAIENATDALVHTKGAAILHMLAAWLGDDVVQRAVRAYLRDHAYGTVTTRDLVHALAAASGRDDIARVLDGFADQPGAPAIEASIECAAGTAPVVRLVQHGPATNAAMASTGRVRWRVPVCVVTGDARTRARVCGIVDGDEARLPLARCPTWVWPNEGGLGYFHSRLTPDGWKALARDGWAQLTPAEQWVAADDAE